MLGEQDRVFPMNDAFRTSEQGPKELKLIGHGCIDHRNGRCYSNTKTIVRASGIVSA